MIQGQQAQREAPEFKDPLDLLAPEELRGLQALVALMELQARPGRRATPEQPAQPDPPDLKVRLASWVLRVRLARLVRKGMLA